LKKQKTVKDIYTYTADHLMDWFPKLGCYENFVQRLNSVPRRCAATQNQITFSKMSGDIH
jgi:hypothetical protein